MTPVSRLLFAGIALAFSGCSETDPATKPLVVGMELAYPPFEMRGPDNLPDGISVRMAEDLARQLGRPLEIRDVEWSGIIPALQSGKIDLIISSMTRTEERAQTIDFSEGYVTNGICMLVAKDSALQSAADLKPGTHKVAVKLSTTGHQWARAEMPDLQLVVLDDSSACALEVVQGKVDAFIYDQISIYQYWKQYEDKTRPILKPIREETWAVGIKKGNEDLRSAVNAFLSDYRSQGKFDELAERYMAEQKASFEAMGVPFIFH